MGAVTISKKKFIKDYNGGASSVAMAKKYHISTVTVLKHLRKFGVKIRSNGARVIFID